MLSLGIQNGQLSSLNKCKKVHSNVSLPFETDSYIVNNTTFTWVFVYLGGLYLDQKINFTNVAFRLYIVHILI